MKSCFKEVRHPLLKVVFHCSSSNGVGEGYTPRGFKPVFPYSAFCFLVVSLMVKDNATRSAGLSGFSGLRISTMIYMLHRQLSGTEQAAVNSSHSSAGAEKNHRPLKKNHLRYLAHG